MSRTPHPTNTHHIIYVLYNMAKQGFQQLYVGKTSHSAWYRRQKHIDAAFQPNAHMKPLSRYIKRIGPHNLGVFPLQQVKQWSLSHHFERLWIHRLKSHVPHTPMQQPLNNLAEHFPLSHRIRSRGRSHHTVLPPANILSHPIAHTVTHLIGLTGQARESTLDNITLSKLLKVFSVLSNKRITHYASPMPLSTSYSELHQFLTLKYNPWSLSTLANDTATVISNKCAQYKLHVKRAKHATPLPMEILLLRDFHSVYQRLPIRASLAQVQHLLPRKLRDLDIKIVYSNAPATSRTLYNFREIALAPQNPAPESCICNNPALAPFLRQHGHVDTTDLSILLVLSQNRIAAQRLQQLMNKGTKYVEHQQFKPQDLEATILAAVDDYTDKACQHDASLQPTDLDDWGESLARLLYDAAKHTPHHNTLPTLEQHDVKQLIRFLHAHFVVNNGDKLTNNYSITCQHWWHDTLISSTIGPQQRTYHISPHTEDEVVERHTAYLACNHYNVEPCLPYKRIQCKYHKDGIRPLTAATRVSTTALSKDLNTALTTLIDALREDANHFQLLHGFTWFLDIDNAMDLQNWLNDLNTNPQHQPVSIHTADATGFYDHIAHSALIKMYRSEIPRIFQFKQRSFLITTSRGTYQWSNTTVKDTPYRHCFSTRKLINLLQWKLRNQFIKVGPHIVQQKIGIGQGDNHSGHQSRFLAICYERLCITKLTNTQPDLARKFANMRRKHDNLIFINFPDYLQYVHFRSHSPGLYPYFINLNPTNAAPFTSAHYLDTTIHLAKNRFKFHDNPLSGKSMDQLVEIARDNNIPITKKSKQALIARLADHLKPQHNYHDKDAIWVTRTYNKRDDFPDSVAPVSYVHYSSNVPNHVKFGIILGRLNSLSITNSHSPHIFADNVAKFLHHLATHNRYPFHTLIRAFTRYVSNAKSPPYRLPASILTSMIHKHLCFLRINGL